MQVFDEYAAYYDLIYSSKDYAGEASYIDSLLKKYGNLPRRILELGCGTGKHATLLADKGYDVCGLDQSGVMLKQAMKHGGMGGDTSAILVHGLSKQIYELSICRKNSMLP